MVLEVLDGPFNREQAELLGRLLTSLDAEQRGWLSGFLAGWRAGSGAVGRQPTPPDPALTPVAETSTVTVLYGSQTGNARGLAQELARRLRAAGLQTDLRPMGEYETRRLAGAGVLLLVTSTQGDGDPPDSAMAFCEFIHGHRAPRLESVRFAVLALGDRSYEHFCKTGRDLDERLEMLGARRIHPRADCDLDYERDAEAWMGGVRDALARELASGAAAPAPAVSLAAATGVAGAVGTAMAAAATRAATDPPHSRSNPFPAEVLENLDLAGRGADRATHHLDLSLAGSGLAFEPGDSVGIVPENDPDLVEGVLAEMGWSPETPVPAGAGGAAVPLREALLRHYEITVLTEPLLRRAAAFSRDGLVDLLRPGREADLRAYVHGRDLLDLVRDFSLRRPPAAEFVGALRRVPGRLYSVASSPRVNPEEVHLLVREVSYESAGRLRRGVCSGYCINRVGPGDRLPVYVQRNPEFRLPADPDAPVIMIGPGTGVAPFRAFVQERAEAGAAGRNWLFFGDRHFRTDFLYQTEWQEWLRRAVLSRLDVAFSRDGASRTHVQHRMRQRAAELYAWLEEGAHLYVCGDRQHMARDVHAELEAIVATQGGMDADAAHEYVAALRRQHRYQRDVY